MPIAVKRLSKARWIISGLVLGVIGAGRLVDSWLITVAGICLGATAWLMEPLIERHRAATRWPEQLSPTQRNAFLRIMQLSEPGIASVAHVPASSGARDFAAYLSDLLLQARWLVEKDALYWTPSPEPVGLHLTTSAEPPPHVATLRRALAELGFNVTMSRTAPIYQAGVTVLVGARPR
jgi:hypothetical protein